MKQLGQYASEIEGMEDFWKDVGILPDYSCNTDGYFNGYLVEFKLDSFDPAKVLEQLKRYVVSRNSAAKELPRYGVGICINKGTYQVYDLLKGNENFTLSGKWTDVTDFLSKVNIKGTKITQKGWIDITSLVDYNDLYFSISKNTSKDSFIAELANPKVLNINPYTWNKTGKMESSLLDCIGSTGLKKRLGAFFTPDYCVENSTKYLMDIINSLPAGTDYVIVDRCAGTGNLEKFLTDDVLSHCILNTITYAEWCTLKGLYDGRAKAILPIDDSSLNNEGLLTDGDALGEKFYQTLLPMLENKVVICLENPPYSEPQAEATRSGKTSKGSFNNFITEEMKKVIKGKTTTDLANKFIWSSFEILKANYNIIYSPIKYWKTQHLIDKKFLNGIITNRKDFHATEAGISIISWENINENNSELKLENCTIKKVINPAGKILPASKRNIIDFYFTSYSGTPDFKNGFLSSGKKAAGNAGGISKCSVIDDAKERFPLFAANCYTCRGFLEKEVIMKSGDGGLAYLQDADFVNDCLIWVGFSDKNKCISYNENSNTIKNECCINQMTKLDSIIDPIVYQNKAKDLYTSWNLILTLTKATQEYNPNFNYGLFQIEEQIDIREQVTRADGSLAVNKKGEPVYEHKYTALHSMITDFKKKLSKYYVDYIAPKLFQYELLK